MAMILAMLVGAVIGGVCGWTGYWFGRAEGMSRRKPDIELPGAVSYVNPATINGGGAATMKQQITAEDPEEGPKPFPFYRRAINDE